MIKVKLNLFTELNSLKKVTFSADNIDILKSIIKFFTQYIMCNLYCMGEKKNTKSPTFFTWLRATEQLCIRAAGSWTFCVPSQVLEFSC